MIYVYAITDRPDARLPDVAGLQDAPLSAVVAGGLVGVCSHHDGGADLRASEQALWRHETVLEALMGDRTVLPVRFGTRLPRHRDLAALLESADAALQAAIDRVRDHVELGVRVRWDRSPEPSSGPRPTTGRAYLAARLAEEQRGRAYRDLAQRRADTVHLPLAEHATDSSRRLLPAPGTLLAAAYLVPRESVDRFRAHVTAVAHANADLQVVCTGPWPPYHFSPRIEEPDDA